MARSTVDVSAGREYLARLASMGEFQPTKPIADYKPGYVQTLVTGFRRQERAGLPVSRQAARGHVVTPEHGKGGRGGARPKLPAAAQEYRGGKLPRSKYTHATQPLKLPRIHKRPINVPERLDLSDGSVTTVHFETPEMLHELRLAANADDRVVLTGFDCDLGVYRSIWINRGHNPGMKARAILEQFRDDSGGRDFEDWFIGVANTTDSDPEQAYQRIGHVCIWTIYRYPSNAHLRRRGA